MHHETDDCKQIFAMLSQYLDLELPAEACQELEKHLAGCPPCIEFAESLRKTVALCHEYESREMPAPISQSARERLQQAWQRALAGGKRDPQP